MKFKTIQRGLPFAGLCFLLITGSVSCKKDLRSSSSPEGVTTTPRATSYSLVWDEEFNGTGVNTANWNIDVGNPHVNNELESYQAANATVSNGNLVITARQQQSPDGQPYTSAKLETAGKFSITYGRIEARIQLPMVQGTWPAFWMLGADINSGTPWPDCGEIDIMEHVNTTNTILGTMHWNGGSGHVQYGSSTTTTPGAFHVYAVEWDASMATTRRPRATPIFKTPSAISRATPGSRPIISIATPAGAASRPPSSPRP